MGRMRAFHARGCCRTCGQTNLRGVDGQGSPHGPLSNGAVFVGGWHARGSYMPARADILAGGCWAGLSAMENAAARPQVRSYVPLSPPQGSQLCPVCLSISPRLLVCARDCWCGRWWHARQAWGGVRGEMWTFYVLNKKLDFFLFRILPLTTTTHTHKVVR
jgi:hypothetical protein